MRCGKTQGKSLHVEIETCKIVDVQMVAFHTNIVTLLLWKTRTFPSSLKQVTRGHNIVAMDGQGHPTPIHSPTPIPHGEKKRVHEGYRRDRTPVSMKGTWRKEGSTLGVQERLNPSLNEGYMKKRRGYMRGTGETKPQSQ